MALASAGVPRSAASRAGAAERTAARSVIVLVMISSLSISSTADRGRQCLVERRERPAEEGLERARVRDLVAEQAVQVVGPMAVEPVLRRAAVGLRDGDLAHAVLAGLALRPRDAPDALDHLLVGHRLR